MSWRGNCVKIFLENSHDVREGRKDENNMKDEYVAYVGTYTHGSSIGIHLYDVNVEEGTLTERKVIPVNNSSHIARSLNGKYLYSIADEGVAVFAVEDDGDLTPINKVDIDGMRGCYLSVDKTGRYLFVAGYHDGKITVLRLREDGGVGEITEEIYHKGMGSIAERNFRPHVNCVKMTRDNHYLMVADIGMDHVDVYRLNHETGKLKHVDVIRSELESAPRHIKMTKDGKFVYIVHELKNYIDVYSYVEEDGNPFFTKVQNIPTLNDYHAGGSAASALNFSADEKYLVSSNAGDNSVIIYRIDHKTGFLEKILCLPISGDYPKDAALFPDNKHLISLNHESNTMTFFTVDLEKGLLVMNGKELPIESPNCVIFHKLQG